MDGRREGASEVAAETAAGAEIRPRFARPPPRPGPGEVERVDVGLFEGIIKLMTGDHNNSNLKSNGLPVDSVRVVEVAVREDERLGPTGLMRRFGSNDEVVKFDVPSHQTCQKACSAIVVPQTPVTMYHQKHSLAVYSTGDSGAAAKHRTWTALIRAPGFTAFVECSVRFEEATPLAVAASTYLTVVMLPSCHNRYGGD